MAEEKNDKGPADPGKSLPPSLEKHLLGIIREADLHEFREQLPAEFLTDAVEGLHQIRDTHQMESAVKQLNQQMQHQLAHRKNRNHRRYAGNPVSTYWAIAVIILLTIIGFMLVRMTLAK